MRLIDADVLLDKTVRRNSAWNSITNSEGKNLEEIVLELPSKDRSVQDFVDKCRECGKQAVTERTGYWILKEITRYSHEAYYECSECGRVITLPLCRYETINSINLRLGKEYPYCNCGCRMQESEEN